MERQGLRWLRRQLHRARDTILCRRMRAQPRRLGISPAGQAIREGNGGKAAGAGGKGIDDAAGHIVYGTGVFGNPARVVSARSNDQITEASLLRKGRVPYRRKVIAEATTGSISRVNAHVASASQRPCSPNSRLPTAAAIPTRFKTSNTV